MQRAFQRAGLLIVSHVEFEYKFLRFFEMLSWLYLEKVQAGIHPISEPAANHITLESPNSVSEQNCFKNQHAGVRTQNL